MVRWTTPLPFQYLVNLTGDLIGCRLWLELAAGDARDDLAVRLGGFVRMRGEIANARVVGRGILERGVVGTAGHVRVLPARLPGGDRPGRLGDLEIDLGGRHIAHEVKGLGKTLARRV